MGYAEIAARLKGDPSPVLKEACAHLRSRLPTLWSRRDFAATVRSVTKTAVWHSIATKRGT